MSNHSPQSLLDQLGAALAAAPNLQAATEIKNAWIKTHIQTLQTNLRDASIETKRTIGMVINQLREGCKVLFEQIKNQFEQQDFQIIPVDLSLANGAINLPKPHWLNLVLARACEWFVKMNFQINTGNEVVSYAENFDLLNIGPNHPSRLNSDSFYFNDNFMLRTHNTAHTAKVLSEQQPKADLRVVTFGNVFRNDPDDQTHTHQFMQIDFIWVQKNLSLANLKWVIQSFLAYVFEHDVKLRFRPSFFPFTEPSFEVDLACVKCTQMGCSACKQTGWIEVLGSGMINPQVLKNTGYDPVEFKAIAAGIGVERLAMIKYQINDIRHFYNNDIRFFQ